MRISYDIERREKEEDSTYIKRIIEKTLMPSHSDSLATRHHRICST